MRYLAVSPQKSTDPLPEAAAIFVSSSGRGSGPTVSRHADSTSELDTPFGRYTVRARPLLVALSSSRKWRVRRLSKRNCRLMLTVTLPLFSTRKLPVKNQQQSLHPHPHPPYRHGKMPPGDVSQVNPSRYYVWYRCQSRG